MRHLVAGLIASVLCGSFGCATILRGGDRDLTVWGPEDLRVAANGQNLRMEPAASERGVKRYDLRVPKETETLTVESRGVKAPVKLEKHASAAWVVLDVIFISTVLPLVIDWATGNWSNFDDADVTTPLLAAGWARPPGYGAPVAVAQRDVPKPALPRKAEPPPPQQLATAPPRRTVITSGKLAVLDFKNSAKDLKAEDVRYFTDVVRGTSLKVAPGLDVMTRENLITLLSATGKDLGQCEGQCEVDTGRRIGADAIISGDVLKVGSRYHISLKLHETQDGRLLSTSIATGRTIDELDEDLQKAATSLLSP